MTPHRDGARRATARAFVEGWQYVDRAPHTRVVPATGAPDNDVLLAAYLRGMCCRWAKRFDELDQALATIGEA